MRPRANRLAQETSPYLLQHAHNPVDWYPWGEEAMAEARRRDCPILLSVGYAACHWCHVMERESFEDPAVARRMNEWFVCVKVDREERPDVDSRYMAAVQMLSGSGGWPMTVFITADGEPFYGGTYYPPQSRFGYPGFGDLLSAIHDAWMNRRSAVVEQAASIAADVSRHLALGAAGPRADAGEALFDSAYQPLAAAFDQQHAGFGRAPKFPQPSHIEYLLRNHLRTRRDGGREMAAATLRAMADGGIHDQVGGGFHRYSTDREWLVPHFEKMLYDNAQLAVAYLHGWQVTGEPRLRSVAEGCLDYILRDLAHPAGGFFCSQDADTDGVEGATYLWTPAQACEAVGAEGERVCALLDITPEGNWEGQSIPRRSRTTGETAGSTDRDDALLAVALPRLLAARRLRPQPALDDKVLSAWTGLAIAALAECGAVLHRPDYLSAAVRGLDFVRTVMLQPTDAGLRLWRSWRNGAHRAHGVLEDYAFTASAALAVFQASGPAWALEFARAATTSAVELFGDPDTGGFFDTASSDVPLGRARDWDDNAVPSANSVMVENLLMLGSLLGEDALIARADRALQHLAESVRVQPMAFTRALCAVDRLIGPRHEIVVAGLVDDPIVTSLDTAVRAAWLPNAVIAPLVGDGAPDLALFSGRTGPAAYICSGGACNVPARTPAAVREQLAQLRA